MEDEEEWWEEEWRTLDEEQMRLNHIDHEIDELIRRKRRKLANLGILEEIMTYFDIEPQVARWNKAHAITNKKNWVNLLKLFEKYWDPKTRCFKVDPLDLLTTFFEWWNPHNSRFEIPQNIEEELEEMEY